MFVCACLRVSCHRYLLFACNIHAKAPDSRLQLQYGSCRLPKYTTHSINNVAIITLTHLFLLQHSYSQKNIYGIFRFVYFRISFGKSANFPHTVCANTDKLFCLLISLQLHLFYAYEYFVWTHITIVVVTVGCVMRVACRKCNSIEGVEKVVVVSLINDCECFVINVKTVCFHIEK